MKVGVEIFNNKDDYEEGMFCTDFSFDNTNEEQDFGELLNLLTTSLKQDKYIVLFKQE